MRTEIVVILTALLLAGCAQPVYNSTPTPKEEMPPPVEILFNESPVAPSVAESSPSVYLNPSTISLEVGQTTTVQVWADWMGKISSVTLEMSFDPQMVQVEDGDPGQEGVQAVAGALMPVVLENRIEGGYLVYHAAVPGKTADDTGILLSLQLRGVNPGTTFLRFERVAAQGVAGEPVDISALSDGIVTIRGAAATSPGGEVPGPTVAPTPMATPVLWPTAQPTLQPSVTGGIYYVVGPGENLFRIGLKFGTTAEAIAAASHIPDPRQVSVGTMILVPVPPPGGGYGYYVRPGDTLYSIARRFGMTVEELASLNGIGSDYTIRADTILKVIPR